MQIINEVYPSALKNYKLFLKWKKKDPMVYPPFINKDWAEAYISLLKKWQRDEAEKIKERIKEEEKLLQTKQKEKLEKLKKIKKEKALEEKRKQKLEEEERAHKDLLDKVKDRLHFKPLEKAFRGIEFFMKPKNSKVLKAFKVSSNSLDVFFLRNQLENLKLFKSFESLLCIPFITISPFPYQLETAKKVLKQFRGRVLLSDEVGLGKTIEAGLVLKEYLTRGLVKKVLIITPASLVSQWQEELLTKFGIEFTTTQNPNLKEDPDNFWKENLVIASIATVRRDKHTRIVSKLNYDLIIVDEAHHLKNRKSKNWQTINLLQKKFILLLSATPVQNNLIELYNLLTLLKPGIFKTEKDFKEAYVSPQNPRIPLNRGKLQDLMRDIMIRNTRSLVDIKLPPRTVLTIRKDFSTEELNAYKKINKLIIDSYDKTSSTQKLQFQHLLQAAGSTHFTIYNSLNKFIENHKENLSSEWMELLKIYKHIDKSTKVETLIELLKKNPNEKKIIFVRHTETLNYLSKELEKNKLEHVIFSGSISAREKDEAVENFKELYPILLSTESGGEGRNLQFCNTLINFDLPWNPQVIEQRIGRIHRIGQEREVFVFNLTSKNTLEDYLLKILDEKINMFELVVGEIQSILGEMDSEDDFNSLVYKSWLDSSNNNQSEPFTQLGEGLLKAKEEYINSKTLDESLFGDEFEVLI